MHVHKLFFFFWLSERKIKEIYDGQIIRDLSHLAKLCVSSSFPHSFQWNRVNSNFDHVLFVAMIGYIYSACQGFVA